MSRNRAAFDHLSEREKYRKMEELKKIVADLRLSKATKEEALRGLRVLEDHFKIPGRNYNS